MSFLKRFLRRGCSHRFAWPRLGGDGQHYQICIICGTAYEYDWKGMRRTDRILATNGLTFAPTRLPEPVKIAQETPR